VFSKIISTRGGGMTDEERDEANQWAREAVDRNLQPMKDSSVFASILSGDLTKEPLCALQLGLAILLDKPIILIVDHAVKLPKHLVKIAEVIERVDIKDPATVERASKSIRDFAHKLKGENRV
jgi:hypothetical protein